MKPANKPLPLFFIAIALCSCGEFKNKNEGAIVIPFVFENYRIVINAVINGEEGRYFWDTGAYETVTTIPSHTGYFVKKDIVLNGRTVNTTSRMDRFIPNTPGWERINSIFEDEGFDGLLGFSVFNGRWCELSFTENKIILHKTKPDKFSVPAEGYVSRRGVPHIIGSINGSVPVTMLVDTGAPGPFHFPRELLQKINPGEYMEILTENDTHYGIPVRSIGVLDDVFTDKIIITDEFATFHMVGIMGARYLQYYDFLFDITLGTEPRRMYYIPRFPETDKNALEFPNIQNAGPRLGITHMLNTQGRFLIRVWNPSVAHDEYGLMPGMTITHVNGVFLGSLTLNEASLLFGEMVDDENCEITIIDTDNQQRAVRRNKQ